MSEADPERPIVAEAPRPRRRWWRWLLGAVAALVLLVAGLAAFLDTGPGHRFVAARIAALRPANGLRFSVGRIEGSIYSRAVIDDLRVYDPHGLVFASPRVALDWSPLAWLHNRLDITSVTAARATLAKLPQLRPTGRTGAILPGFDIHVGTLRIDALTIGAAIAGQPRQGRLAGTADIRHGRALVDLAAAVDGSDRLTARINAQPDRNRFDIDVHAAGAAHGLLAVASGFGRSVRLDIAGDGGWRAWRGTATAAVGGARVLDLALANHAGHYALSGHVATATIAHGKVLRLTGPRVAVAGTATLEDRQLAGTLSLHSPALLVRARGTIDLAASAYRRVAIAARLLQPQALFPNMTGRDIELRATLDGAFRSAAFTYALAADHVAFDDTGFDRVRANGAGHLSRAPVTVPLRLSAAQVTGVGDVAGGILRNLTVAGPLRVTPDLLTGHALSLASDKLAGRLDLVVDLKTGQYRVGLSGALLRYLIPGLGIVDVRSDLQAVPGPGGHGTRIVGHGSAQMVRLDNAFFRSLSGGLPHIETALERATDGTLYLHRLVLTAPTIRIAGEGYRRRDGSFHFEGQGEQASYGPFTILLDGQIDHPTLDLHFAHPNPTLGLADVVAHLDPNAAGFAFQAHGRSRLGAFSGHGQIALPPGQAAVIQIAALDVSGTRARGNVTIASGGFAGRLALAGGGIGGTIDLAPVGTDQRIAGHLNLAKATLAGAGALAQGALDFTTVLDPAGSTVDASLVGRGYRRGALSIARIAANVHLVGGTGRITASVAGSRGRAFDIETTVDVTNAGYRVQTEGTVEGQPLKLETPAAIVHDGDTWRLAPTKLSFAGGEAQVAGRFGGGTAIDLTLKQMPLTILDIGYPGLGLGGYASGTLAYAAQAVGQPTGRIAMTVRELSRSGLVLSSRPIDVGVAGILAPAKAALRAVMQSDGKTIGRLQAQLSPLGPGDLATRIANAPLFAQLRYSGPADTLWRLTGVELFDLTGPVAVGADATGRLSAPQIRGVLSTTGARIESAVTGTVLTNVAAQGRFDGSRLVIDRFGADAGKAGTVTGAGSFDFAAAHGFGIDLKLDAKDAVLINTDSIGATVTGPLSFTSDGSGGTIAGDVRLVKSRYVLGRATAASAVPQLAIEEVNLPGGGVEQDVPSVPWTLKIHAVAPNALDVTGLGLDSEWSAKLDIAGDPSNPAITGRADLIRGNYEFAGREFQLDRGIIRFAGDVPVNPALDISANASETGLDATIRVTGYAQKPEISFTSTPALPEDELLSRLLFGTSITNLSAPEALQLAAAVAALENGGGGLNPINAVRRAVGLDRLRILPADPETGAGTSVAAGKYITRRLYAEIVTDGQGYSATDVEFQVTRWLSLLSSISTLGRESGNIRVSKDY